MQRLLRSAARTPDRPRRPSPDPSPLSEAGGRALQFCHLLGCRGKEGVAGSSCAVSVLSFGDSYQGAPSGVP